MNLDILKHDIKKHVTLKMYIIYLGFAAMVFLFMGQLLTAFMLMTAFMLALVLYDKNKKRLRI